MVRILINGGACQGVKMDRLGRRNPSPRDTGPRHAGGRVPIGDGAVPRVRKHDEMDINRLKFTVPLG